MRAGGINVLYFVGTKRIGGGPGAEQRFVRAALAHSPDIVVERRLVNYEPMGMDITDVLGRAGAGRPAVGGGAGPGNRENSAANLVCVEKPSEFSRFPGPTPLMTVYPHEQR